MATNSPVQGFRVPDEADTPDPPRDFANLAADVEKRVMMVFASATDRDAKLTAPTEGMFAYLKDTNAVTYHDGSGWTPFPPAQVKITSGTGAPDNSTGSNNDVYFRV